MHTLTYMQQRMAHAALRIMAFCGAQVPSLRRSGALSMGLLLLCSTGFCVDDLVVEKRVNQFHDVSRIRSMQIGMSVGYSSLH